MRILIHFLCYPILILALGMTTIVFGLDSKPTPQSDFKTGLIQEVQQLEQNIQSTTTPDEAMRVSKQYQSISNNAKSQNIVSMMQSISNIAIVPKIKNIITEIQFLSQNLVDLVKPGGVPSTPDPVKINAIVNKMDVERKSLTGFILPNPTDKQPFNPQKFDRPKENKMQIYNNK